MNLSELFPCRTDVANEKPAGAAKKTLQGIFSKQSTADGKDGGTSFEKQLSTQDIGFNNSWSSTLKSENGRKGDFANYKKKFTTISGWLTFFDEMLGQKRQIYFYSLVLEFFCVLLHLSDSTLRTSIFT